MPVSPGFAAFVLDQMAPLGGVSSRRMFGGHGIFRDGRMFALILGDVLYFKVDDLNVRRFTDRGLGPFTYEARGKPMALRYHRAPPEVYDDVQAMVEWARSALDCALRVPAKAARTRRAEPR